jgi:hypothetical protein
MPDPGRNTFLIENDGPAIVQTTFWDTDMARNGLMHLSWNAGAGRLLVPDGLAAVLRDEVGGASEVLVSRGPWREQGNRDALELLWDDGSECPFAVHIVAEQSDRRIPESQQGGGFFISVWTRAGLQATWPGRYRVVDVIPWLRPWEASEPLRTSTTPP